MNTKDEENGALAGPLIFIVPAYGFVMALYLDWLGRTQSVERGRRIARPQTVSSAIEVVPGRERNCRYRSGILGSHYRSAGRGIRSLLSSGPATVLFPHHV
jgi:hypothetical protein